MASRISLSTRLFGQVVADFLVRQEAARLAHLDERLQLMTALGDFFFGEGGFFQAELAHQRALLGARHLHAQRLGLDLGFGIDRCRLRRRLRGPRSPRPPASPTSCLPARRPFRRACPWPAGSVGGALAVAREAVPRSSPTPRPCPWPRGLQRRPSSCAGAAAGLALVAGEALDGAAGFLAVMRFLVEWAFGSPGLGPVQAAHDASRLIAARWPCRGEAHAADGQDAKGRCRAVERA